MNFWEKEEFEQFKEPGDAVFCIMEQLYNAENAIDEKAITNAFSALCDMFAINDEMLKQGLNVAHFTQKTTL